MFNYQVASMRETINRHLRRSHPPREVGILREHAEFLNLNFAHADRVNEVRPSGLISGVDYGSVVMVKLSDIFTSLQTAVGIDDENYHRSDDSVGGT